MPPAKPTPSLILNGEMVNRFAVGGVVATTLNPGPPLLLYAASPYHHLTTVTSYQCLLFTKKRMIMPKFVTRREAPAVNAGSMADIAFLLLIFFLVTTKILSDQGILVRLPPYAETPPTGRVNDRNVLRVSLNARNELQVEDEEVALAQLQDAVVAFITNPDGSTDWAESPRKAVVSLLNDRGTAYHAYLGVYNEIMAAYQGIWEAAARERYAHAYQELSEKQQAAIRADYPLVVSEAEPTDYE